MLTLRNLEICFCEAMKRRKNYIGILVEEKGYFMPELVIIPQMNFAKKLAFLASQYDEYLIKTSDPDIRIIGFTHGDSCKDLQSDLYEGGRKNECKII